MRVGMPETITLYWRWKWWKLVDILSVFWGFFTCCDKQSYSTGFHTKESNWSKKGNNTGSKPHWYKALRLKHSQYKNDATQLKNFLGLKLPPSFLHRVGDEKGGNFKIKKFFNWTVPFLYWLHFRLVSFHFQQSLEIETFGLLKENHHQQVSIIKTGINRT